MAVRRRKTGRSLLVATVGIAVSACGLDKKDDNLELMVTGNLVPPPTVELCVDIEPADAHVTVDDRLLTDKHCQQVYRSAQIAATSDGYQDYNETVSVEQSKTIVVNMIPAAEEAERHRPTGNMIAPPRAERHELCVTVTPANAVVEINGKTITGEECHSVDKRVIITATAHGYQDYVKGIMVDSDQKHVINMISESKK